MKQTDDWQKCLRTTCRECGSEKVLYREVTSFDGAHDDYKYRCQKCGYSWWVDGIDS